MEVQFQSQQFPERNLCSPLPYSHNFMEMGGFCNPCQLLQQSPLLLQQKSQTHVVNHQVSTCNPLFSMAVSAQLEREKQEINRFIALQNERLRVFLQEQRKQQMVFLIRTLEAKALFLLSKMEEEIAKETGRTAQLEECLKRVEMESQTWKRIAGENEAMAVALNNTLALMREKRAFPAEDVESCCDFSGAPNAYAYAHAQRKLEEEEKEDGGEKMACKACNYRESCFLILPCKHLCSCEACEALLDSCPVCKSVKEASIEVYMF